MTRSTHPNKAHPNRSRRDFLRMAGITAGGLLAGACQPRPAVTGEPGPTRAPISATAQPTLSQVAIGQARTYERDTIERQLQTMLDQLGGLGDVVTPGDRVAIKVNLTGGVTSGRVQGMAEVQSFVTHPEVVRALAGQVLAAGAKEVFIVEAVYEWASYQQWGYETLARDLGVTLVDLNEAQPFGDFVEALVGAGNFIYPSFRFHPLLADLDVFMSVSKMKNHDLAGVTHTMKNLYGLVPYRFYRTNTGDRYRSGFHGPANETQRRLPRIIVDLNRARPIHFSLIDGIQSIQGGEGPWIANVSPIEPGVLIAGKNAVATDAVATAVMGYDPTGEYPITPFVRCDNHLNLAARAGLGTNRLEEIEVVGATVEQVKVHFRGPNSG